MIICNTFQRNNGTYKKIRKAMDFQKIQII